MEEKHHNHNGFGNGFLLGLLIGIIATLLLTTKKGREILREFTEKGLGKVSDLERKLEKTTSEAVSEFDEFDDESEYVSPTPPKGIKQIEKLEKHNNGNGSQKSVRHRFFRASKKS